MQGDGGWNGIGRDIEDHDGVDRVAGIDLGVHGLGVLQVDGSRGVGRVLPTLGVDQRLVVPEEGLSLVSDIRHRDVDQGECSLGLRSEHVIPDRGKAGLHVRDHELKLAVGRRHADSWGVVDRLLGRGLGGGLARSFGGGLRLRCRG